MLSREQAIALEVERMRDQALAVLADARMRDDVHRIAESGCDGSQRDYDIVQIVFNAVAAYINLGGR